MIVSGIDIGSRSSKCVIIGQDGTQAKILASHVLLTTPDSEETARSVLNLTLQKIGIALTDLRYIVSTGYGRVNVSIANKTITEISCHAKGVAWYYPNVKTILDIGGQDCKVIACNDGKVTNFIMNDKCAAGTGRYLERIAALLQVSLENIGSLSLEGMYTPEVIQSYCAVFAEQDVVSLLWQGKRHCDILAGACDAVVKRISPMITRIGMKNDFSISGGVAKNIGIIKRLEKEWGANAYISPDPQIIGAIGAAFFSLEHAR